MEMFQEVFSS